MMEKLHAIYPGALKPFHDGHYLQIKKYLENEDYDIDVVIIISSADREGIKAKTTKKFIDKVYRSNKKVDVVVAESPSPIKDMYQMINDGKGVYTMISSSKGDDKKRVDELVNYYKEGSKHHKDGVEVIYPPIDLSPITYRNRIDDYSEKEISSTIVRNDVRNDDFEAFKTSYFHMLSDGVVTEKDLEKYFDDIKKEVLPYKNSTLYDNKLEESFFNNIINWNPLNEGGMAGHMSHPYEVDEFTFADLKELNDNLFNAKIEHMTEKLDGQNLFASVNRKGQTVFARNMTDMTNGGMLIDDMAEKWKDNADIATSFVNGGKVIDQVFRKIKDRTLWFNRDRISNSYKIWVNCEIINSISANVIPYDNNCVYFHEIKSYMVKEDGKECFRQIDNSSSKESDVEILKTASDKVQNSAITNEIVMRQLSNNEVAITKFNSKLDSIANKYGCSNNNSLMDWKSNALKKQLDNTPLNIIYQFKDLQKLLEKRWLGNSKETTIRDIKAVAADSMKEFGMSKNEIKDILELISKYDKELIKPIVKKVLKPLDKYFIDLGNEVIKRCKGFNNDGNEMKVISKLKNEIKTTIAEVQKDNDIDKMNKLKEQLHRLQETGDRVNATEGVVLRFKGKTIKLTGSFAAINQILGMNRYDR